jgi:hypothetical protein
MPDDKDRSRDIGTFYAKRRAAALADRADPRDTAPPEPAPKRKAAPKAKAKPRSTKE